MLRTSSRPRRWWRRFLASRAAMRRARGCRLRRRAARSSGLAWRKSTSAGRGRRTALATASGPSSATSRRRTSSSISTFSRSRRATSSSRRRVSSRAEPCAAATGQQPLEDAVDVELSQRAEHVVAPADGAGGVHAGQAGDGLPGQLGQELVVARFQGGVDEVGQLAGGEGVVAAEDRHAHREPHVEHGVERRPVLLALDQGRGQRPPQRLPVLERDLADRLDRVEVLGGRHRQPGAAQLLDEAGQRLEHGRGSPPTVI